MGIVVGSATGYNWCDGGANLRTDSPRAAAILEVPPQRTRRADLLAADHTTRLRLRDRGEPRGELPRASSQPVARPRRDDELIQRHCAPRIPRVLREPFLDQPLIVYRQFIRRQRLLRHLQ